MPKAKVSRFKFSGDILQIRRKLLRYSLDEMGVLLRVSGVTIRNWEKGAMYPHPKRLERIAEVIQMKPQHLLLQDLSDRTKSLRGK